MIDMIPIPEHVLLPDRTGPEFPWDDQPTIDDPILPADPGDEPDNDGDDQ